MAKLKSALHHWWPRGVSKNWADGNDFVYRLSPDGEVRQAPPERFGAIHGGHHIKLSHIEGGTTDWDESFEEVFDKADRNFPGVIDWLKGLDRPTENGSSSHTRFHTVAAHEERLRVLVECLVSLAVRSPMNREAAASVAEYLRGPLQRRERNNIIAFNMRNYQRTVADSIGARGKFVILFSPDREFIFGDGFFHNITSPPMAPWAPRLLAPLTPEMSVLHVIPGRYMEAPRLMTTVLSKGETKFLNDTVQVYSKEELFFRSERPRITEHFRNAQHLRYTGHDHWIERLICTIPGVIPFGTLPFDFVTGLRC